MKTHTEIAIAAEFSITSEIIYTYKLSVLHIWNKIGLTQDIYYTIYRIELAF